MAMEAILNVSQSAAPSSGFNKSVGPDGLLQAPFTDSSQPELGAKRTRKTISASDWEARRDMISQLYLDENRSLTEVMEIMQQTHGFQASYETALHLLKVY